MKGIGKRMRNSFTHIIIIGMVWVMTGCSTGTESRETFQEISYPDFKDKLQLDSEDIELPEVSADAVLPVKIYYDNTGSMEGFTINREGKREPSPAYVKLMRCLRDMGRMQKAEYYVLDTSMHDWVVYEDSLYDNFYKKGFHVGWNGEIGPLYKLYMNDGLEADCINIVLTDLAEQNLNNTQLAEQIQKMCDKEGCEADLYAFKFEFNGNTQVPNPDAVSKMLEKLVNGEKPYYMIITGPSDYMGRYRKEMKNLLESEKLKESENYYTATSRVNISREKVSLKDVIFESYASYEEIRQENEEQKKADRDRDANEEKETRETAPNKKSKNLLPYEDTSQICPGVEVAAFYYEKVKGTGRQTDWRLNFYVPLKDFGNKRLKYIYNFNIYKLERLEDEQAQGEAGEKWVEDTNPQIEIESVVQKNFEGLTENNSTVLYVSCKNKEKKDELAENTILIILNIEREESYYCERPDWLDEFDTGDTDDYFTRTFNLKGFYDTLFGNRNKIGEDGMIHVQMNYAQIPILLTDLNE